MGFRIRVVGWCSLGFALLATSPSSASSQSDHHAVDVVWSVGIPMRDGVRLNAVLYKPMHLTSRVPAIYAKTPYLSDREQFHEWGTYLAENGYVVAAVDARGRGDSEGVFRALDGDGLDGYDVVEWLAKQPWCDGKVGSFGGSYVGYDQWATIKQLPPHLRSAVPTASVGAGVDFPMSRNVFSFYALQWLTYVSGKTLKRNAFEDTSFWLRGILEFQKKRLPFHEYNKSMGNPAPMFEEWVSHPDFDDYWQSKMPGPREYRRIDFPILTITGHFDGDQFGAFHYYDGHMRYGTGSARARHYLVVGPWDHAGTRKPMKEAGGRSFSENSVVDMKKLHKEWYDWTLKGLPKPKFLKDRVTYYAMGADEWRSAPTVQAVTQQVRKLYLGSRDGQPIEEFESGTLTDQRSSSPAPDRCTFDPTVTPEWLTLSPPKLSEASRWMGDQLVYHTEPFEEELEVNGSAKLVAWIALDVPDTDIEASLREIKADGSSLALGLGAQPMRARYRESVEQPKLVVEGELHPYQFQFGFTAVRLAKGSRIRLTLRAPLAFSRERNFNRGGVVADETEKDARPAHLALYHDVTHPSYLELPIGKRMRAVHVATGP